MDNLKRCARLVFIAIGFSLLLLGCAAPRTIQTHPALSQKCQNIKSIVFAKPDIKVYLVSAGGVPELMDEWSNLASDNVTKALLAQFEGSGTKISVLKTDPQNEQEMKEVLALFPVVSNAIMYHAAPAQPGFTQSAPMTYETGADYSVGPIPKILDPAGADALLLVHGVDQYASAGKKAVNVLGTVSGVMMSAFTGIVVVPRGEGTTLRIALVDRNGTVLWHNLKGGSTNLRDPDQAKGFVEVALDEFPGLKK
ncbi:hypothetical protein [Geomonas edaphica]|uniref:hypothetical protein n=1 Tax=Geomonas edaphica TaxID=2570226 RepID=UPI0010A80FBE|nr:hypothetical protein [Geomonas edaphica]